MSALRADETIFTLEFESFSGEVRVLTMSGQEGISDLFSFGIELAIPDDAVDFDKIVGKPATLKIHYGEAAREINGIVSRFEQGVAGGRFTPYFVELVPTVWKLTQRYLSRIFQELDVKAIVKKVLEGAGLSSGEHFRIATSGAYKTRTYCVQYRETDWNFVARLLEEEGIFYFFEHKDGKDVLVMGDAAGNHVDIEGAATVLFRGPSGLVEVEEFVYDFRFAQQVRPGKVTLKEYDFVKPALGLKEDKTAAQDTALEVYDYPGLYDSVSDGPRLAEVRLQAAQTRRKQAQGQSVCRRLIPGCTFTLDDVPRASFNQKYLLTWVHHQGSQPLGEHEAGGRFHYHNVFRAIPGDVPFRPTRLTPKPIVEGSQTAVVTGPSGEEIYTDKHGRVKVQFHWDREGGNNDKSSCWIRVSQLWAGEGWGAMFIPRIGHEVVVAFEEGDPDRPMIIGRVYNATNVPPYALDGKKTTSTIKSNSSKGGGGSNEYRYDDTKGKEEIYQHAQKDLLIVTENDKNQSTGHDETLTIGHDRTKTVKNDETTTVKGNRTETVDKDETIGIKGNRTETVNKNETITIDGNRTETVKGNEKIDITGNRDESVKGNENVSITGNRSHKIKGDNTVAITGNDTLSADGNRATTIKGDDSNTVKGTSSLKVTGDTSVDTDGKYSVKSGKTVEIEAAEKITLKTGSASIVLEKNGTITIKGKDITVKGSGKIGVTADGNVTIKGSKILEN